MCCRCVCALCNQSSHLACFTGGCNFVNLNLVNIRLSCGVNYVLRMSYMSCFLLFVAVYYDGVLMMLCLYVLCRVAPSFCAQNEFLNVRLSYKRSTRYYNPKSHFFLFLVICYDDVLVVLCCLLLCAVCCVVVLCCVLLLSVAVCCVQSCFTAGQHSRHMDLVEAFATYYNVFGDFLDVSKIIQTAIRTCLGTVLMHPIKILDTRIFAFVNRSLIATDITSII